MISGGKSLISRIGEEVMNGINVTPLVDVMLVLLIIFIITAPVIHQAFKPDLPKENAQKHQLQENDVTIEISGAGAFSLNGKPFTETARLVELQGFGVRAGSDTRLHLHADQTTRYTNIARVLALMQQAGLTKVSFVTSAPQKAQ
ncbi:biopolymer transport protein ExbD [Desulfovibrio desulfuricans]|uniref:Biopolymer transport protein ExbD n=2 Tax=Desulfovibrio TaxID=872 RepID=A0AA94HSN2_DESDE|nr:biopolymer transporter ExbD [Desulfovibrio desulfuricans]ATD81466.1 biopolymer transporter ExbD [Desulfovibrio sp. G11]SFW36508.1 biopolymer transport protein ExbD [Desulfovibrio desulfuricans]SPD34161.1 Biopolymer transport protein ExbD/TolR [Desulfovibrio sp. G11]